MKEIQKSAISIVRQRGERADTRMSRSHDLLFGEGERKTCAKCLITGFLALPQKCERLVEAHAGEQRVP